MRRQKKIRSLKIPYVRQQEIYVTCQRYALQPQSVRERIEHICDRVTDGDAHKRNALFLVLTSEKPIWRIADEQYMAKTVLYELRKRFYELW